ncbi:hypothetical protein NQ317_006740 [Molorchus minor]|uniref:Uncharacterized protein n=1 Tax=Molorchus minor TaxID=1323400 RepID=A0ABQ9IRX6_9CUCU|nr:hypothetical protein NQ317_006740 [Molorchus minor]
MYNKDITYSSDLLYKETAIMNIRQTFFLRSSLPLLSTLNPFLKKNRISLQGGYFDFEATSAGVIQNYFRYSNKTSYAYGIMALPMCIGSTSYCLAMFASDGDTRLLKAMRINSSPQFPPEGGNQITNLNKSDSCTTSKAPRRVNVSISNTNETMNKSETIYLKQLPLAPNPH